MMLKRWFWVVTVSMMTSLAVTVHVSSAQTARSFRQENGLQPYAPPEWFLKGYFTAREKDPGYLFGPVENFVGLFGGKTAWLIEDMELERIETAERKGKKIEYSLFLEVATPDQTVYWVFVVLPYESAEAWYNGKRSFHGRKAVAYYGKTRDEIAHALALGFKMSAELRFLIENGEISPQVPENVIFHRYKFRPICDLHTGRAPALEDNTK